MNSKIQKILLIGINYAPEPTGIGKYTGEMGSWLAGHGYEVRVITAFPYYPQWKPAPGYRYWWYQTEKRQGAKLIRCPLYVPSKPGGAKRMLQDLGFFLTAWLAVTSLLLRGKKYDMVFVASPSFLSGWVGSWYKRWRPSARLVYHVQDLQVDAAEELGMIRQRWLLGLLKRAEAFVLRRADVVSTISAGMRQRILQKRVPIKKLLLFPNWVDFRAVHPVAPDARIVERLGLPAGKCIVLYSGAVGEKQGLEMILEAADRVQQALPDLHFVIAGSGPYATQLQAQAQQRGLSNLQFLPLQPIEVFNHLLNHAWLHLVVQKAKAADLLLPSKLTNVLAVGGLVLVTANPGTSLHQVINEHELGKLVPAEDTAAFCAAIEWLYHHPQQAGQYRQNAARYAATFLDQSAIIQTFLQQLAGEGGSSE